MKVKIDFDILEYFIRQSERVAVIEGIAEHYPTADMDLIKVICGRQLENIPETRIEESTKDSNKKTVGQLYDEFLDENYESDKEPSSESTPPKNIPPAVWVAVPQGKREPTKEK